jgi:hypothetical protein
MAKKSNFVSASDPFAVAFGIKNDKGQFISRSYLRAYIECWCRVEDECNWYNPDGNVLDNGVPMTRKYIIDHFASDKYLADHVGSTGSNIGHECRLSTMWDRAGAVCGSRTPTDLQEMARRAKGVVTVNPRTAAGKIALAEADTKKKEAEIKIDKEKRYEAIRSADPKQLRRMLTMNLDGMPESFKQVVLQLRSDYAEMKALVKTETKVDAQ